MEKALPTEEPLLFDMLADIQRQRDEIESYVMTLCHELRTPLNAALGKLQVLQAKYQLLPPQMMQPNSAEFTCKMIQTVAETGNPEPMLSIFKEVFGNKGGPAHTANEVDKLVSLGQLQLAIVEDLLDHVRSSTGKGATLHNEPFSINKAMEDAMDCVMNASSKQAGADFDMIVAMDMEDIQMIGDRRRIVQILINLLTNAFKATMHGSVTLRARDFSADRLSAARPCGDLRTICFEIIDTGNGMSKNAVAKNFATPFAAGSSNTTTGLGFGIAVHTVQQILGGTFTVLNEVGVGTTIRIALPLKSVSEDHDVCETPKRMYMADEHFPILVVDDQDMNREVLVSLLEAIGHTTNVDTACDGDDALAMIDARFTKGEPPYRVVFMDVQMQRMNGDDATNKLREVELDEKRTKTYVVGLSAYGNESTIDKCMKKGMDKYCTKPMQLQTLKLVLSGLTTDERFYATLDCSRDGSQHGDSLWTAAIREETPIPPRKLAEEPKSGADAQREAFLNALNNAKRRGTFAERQVAEERAPPPSFSKSIPMCATSCSRGARLRA